MSETKTRKNATRLSDVARLAGVSIATVSRALSDAENVNERTKRQIWQVARDAGYEFKSEMPIMVSRSSSSVAIVLPTPSGREGKISDPFYMEIVAAIAEAARAADCHMIISNFVPQRLDDLEKIMNSYRGDGVIFLGQGNLHEEYNQLSENHQNFIVWGAQLKNQKYCSVGSDNVAGGRRATRHLIRLGRRNIVFLGDPDAPEVGQRYEGYQSALAEAGLPQNLRPVKSAHFEMETAQAATANIFSQHKDIDGIIAAGDLIALGAIRAIENFGLNVPDDISVVGYDDILISQYHRPAITTISQNLSQVGRLIISKILHAGNDVPMGSERLGTELIIRQSCGA